MTAQIPENLLYEGEMVAMMTEPLGDYFALTGLRPEFGGGHCTALWRDYIGDWELVAGRLYLVGLTAGMDGPPFPLDHIFPGFSERVFAHWYSGTLRIPQGRQLHYVHMGYGSTYERDLFLTVARGVIVSTEVRYNGQAEDRAPSARRCGFMGRLAS